MTRTEVRSETLFKLGASVAVARELLAYNAPPDNRPLSGGPTLDWRTPAWQEVIRLARTQPVLPVLRERLVQLNFPIEAGIGRTASYQAAVQRGSIPAPSAGLTLQQPEALTCYLFAGLGGPLPILQTGHRPDFESLVQALAYQNEPQPVPPSMGACLIAGYVHWGRIRDLQAAWLVERGGRMDMGAWAQEFRQQIAPVKALYQDTFLILSEGPYSGVSAESLGLSAGSWREMSLALRREHENAHYFLLQQRDRARHTLFDELLADFHALRVVNGQFRADWLLHFWCLEAYPVYRAGGRLENYREELSAEAFALLQPLVIEAVDRLVLWDRRLPLTESAEYRRQLAQLSQLSLEEFCSVVE